MVSDHIIPITSFMDFSFEYFKGYNSEGLTGAHVISYAQFFL